MSIDLAQFNKIKDALEKAQTKADRAKGKLDQLKEQLKKNFKCPSISAAKTKLKQMTKDKAQAEKDYNKAIKEFEETWETEEE